MLPLYFSTSSHRQLHPTLLPPPTLTNQHPRLRISQFALAVIQTADQASPQAQVLRTSCVCSSVTELPGVARVTKRREEGSERRIGSATERRHQDNAKTRTSSRRLRSAREGTQHQAARKHSRTTRRYIRIESEKVTGIAGRRRVAREGLSVA